MAEINKRHKAASQLKVLPTRIEESLWEVQSESRDVTYSGRRIDTECACKLRCRSCSVCIHMYTCSCVDSAIHSTVCKHCHLVHIKGSMVVSTNQGETVATNEPSDTVTNMMETKCLSYLTHQGSSSHGESSLQRVKNEVVTLANEIQLITTQTIDEVVVKAGLDHLKNAISMMKALQKQDSTSNDSLAPARYIAPNANSEIQARFHSTKRKRQAPTAPGLNKPTLQQMDACISEMTNDVDVKVCGICFMEDDKETSSQEVLWVQCSDCS